MSPTLYKKPDGHREGDLVIREWRRVPITGKLREEDRFLDPSEQSTIAQEAAKVGQPEVIERVSRGERISW